MRSAEYNVILLGTGGEGILQSFHPVRIFILFFRADLQGQKRLDHAMTVLSDIVEKVQATYTPVPVKDLMLDGSSPEVVEALMETTAKVLALALRHTALHLASGIRHAKQTSCTEAHSSPTPACPSSPELAA